MTDYNNTYLQAAMRLDALVQTSDTWIGTDTDTFILQNNVTVSLFTQAVLQLSPTIFHVKDIFSQFDNVVDVSPYLDMQNIDPIFLHYYNKDDIRQIISDPSQYIILAEIIAESSKM